MVDKFEVGEYYRFTGTTRPVEFSSDGEMDFWLDGKPRKCVSVTDDFYAYFTDQPTRKDWFYNGSLPYFEEVDAGERFFEVVSCGREWKVINYVGHKVTEHALRENNWSALKNWDGTLEHLNELRSEEQQGDYYVQYKEIPMEAPKTITLSTLLDANACDGELTALIDEQDTTRFEITHWGQSEVVDRNKEWVVSKGFTLEDEKGKLYQGHVVKRNGSYYIFTQVAPGEYKLIDLYGNRLTDKTYPRGATIDGFEKVAANIEEFFSKDHRGER